MPTKRTKPEAVVSRPRELREILGSRRRVYSTDDLTLTVTPAIVQQSIPRSQCHCVMANAVRSIAPGLVDISVRTSRAFLVYGEDSPEHGYYVVYELPKSTADQVKQYDASGAWVPGEYHLKHMRPSAAGTPSRKGTPRRGIKMPESQKRHRKRHTVPLSGVLLKRNDPSFYGNVVAA